MVMGLKVNIGSGWDCPEEEMEDDLVGKMSSISNILWSEEGDVGNCLYLPYGQMPEKTNVLILT